MKKKDFIFIVCCLAFVGLFILIEPLNNLFMEYSSYKDGRGLLMAFLKFAILATLGESIGLRIQKGVYNMSGFGLAPRAIVWGFLGVVISMAMTIFSSGTPALLSNLGVNTVSTQVGVKLLIAFCISVSMNLFFAPVFMTFHKITDAHILGNGGSLQGLFKPIQFKMIFTQLNWGVLYGFVFKKTIPLFWFPAHTITFMLPAQWRVLCAAILSVALGIFLSIAAARSNATVQNSKANMQS
ncbi:MAG: hypothetical protein LBV41_10870 [Cytophagaceae bacterium]|jgi:hypothetical protein|nr:hypothetical protein [Cytophagaceae bacterium]